MVEIVKLENPPEWAKEKVRAKWGTLPFRTLEVGELCVIPVDEQTTKDLRSFRAVVYVTGKRMDRKFSCNQRADGAFEVYRSE